MNNEVNIEDLEKLLSEARAMYSDSEKKLDENSRRLGMLEDELKKSLERAAMADQNTIDLEESLRQVKCISLTDRPPHCIGFHFI